MKKFLFFALAGLSVLCAATMTSCDKGDGDGPGNSELIGKWNVGANASGIVSVEFGVSGDYVLVVDESFSRAAADYVTYFGTYTLSGDKVILSDFGTMTVNSLAEGVLDFTLNEVAYSGAKAEEMASSTKTDLLCRTWRIVKSQYEGGYSYPDLDPSDGECDAQYVLFSKAGTYLLYYPNGETDLMEWKWKSEAASTIYWRDPSSTYSSGWSEEKFATLETLTQNSFVVYEEYEDDWNKTYLEPK